MRRSLAIAVLAIACSGLGLGIASAAGPEDRAATEAVLREVEASPKKDVAAELVARSKAALERAQRLRAAGDEPRARLADGLAHTWAQAARDVIRAVDVEDRAQAARRAATDAGAQAERERALLEEGLAQSGRLRAQLEATERDSKGEPARTSTQASDLDGGAKGLVTHEARAPEGRAGKPPAKAPPKEAPPKEAPGAPKK